jgi:hypothetical protein
VRKPGRHTLWGDETLTSRRKNVHPGSLAEACVSLCFSPNHLGRVWHHSLDVCVCPLGLFEPFLSRVRNTATTHRGLSPVGGSMSSTRRWCGTCSSASVHCVCGVSLPVCGSGAVWALPSSSVALSLSPHRGREVGERHGCLRGCRESRLGDVAVLPRWSLCGVASQRGCIEEGNMAMALLSRKKYELNLRGRICTPARMRWWSSLRHSLVALVLWLCGTLARWHPGGKCWCTHSHDNDIMHNQRYNVFHSGEGEGRPVPTVSPLTTQRGLANLTMDAQSPPPSPLWCQHTRMWTHLSRSTLAS